MYCNKRRLGCYDHAQVMTRMTLSGKSILRLHWVYLVASLWLLVSCVRCMKFHGRSSNAVIRVFRRTGTRVEEAASERGLAFRKEGVIQKGDNAACTLALSWVPMRERNIGKSSGNTRCQRRCRLSPRLKKSENSRFCMRSEGTLTMAVSFLT